MDCRIGPKAESDYDKRTSWTPTYYCIQLPARIELFPTPRQGVTRPSRTA